MAGFSHRERVLCALNHKEPDRVPLDLGGSFASMMETAYWKLKKYLNLEKCDYETFNSDWFTIVDYDERVLKHFDIDLRRVYLKGSSEYKRITNEDGTWIDELGFTRKFSGIYGEIIDHPLREARNIEDIKKYSFFNAYDPSRIEGLKNRAEYLYNKTDYAVVAGGSVVGLLDMGNLTRGFDQFSIDLLTNKKMAHTLLDKLTTYNLEILDAYLNIVGPYIQIIEMSDDIGGQNNMLISPELYKEMIFPYYKKELDFIKTKTKAKIFHHSCGSVIKGMDLLIEAGIDILDSLQPRAKNMDSTYLKNNYGNDLCFHGGIDIQEVLPHGTKKEIEDEVKRRISIYAPSGGYILCAAHGIQDDVPPENVISLYEFAKKWGDYPLKNEIIDLRKNIPETLS